MPLNDSAEKRETFKDQAYFTERIKHKEDALLKFAAVIASEDTEPSHRGSVSHTIFRRRLELIITRYSAGESIQSLYDEFPLVVSALAEYHSYSGHTPYNFEQFDAYIFALWLISIAILLDVDDRVFDSLVTELGNTGRDALYDRLVALRMPERAQASTLMYPKPYQILIDGLNSAEEKQTTFILKFLKNYYSGMKKTYWHDSHLGKNAGFFGYWCFELAAFVKKLNIDDRAFADNIFYPIDLVKYQK